MSEATALQLGSSVSCAKLPAGLQCWGTDASGFSSARPRAYSNLVDLQQVKNSSLFGCALRSTGTVSCWGVNLVGQLGAGNAPSPDTKFKVSLKDLKQSPQALVESFPPTRVQNLTDATAIAVGGSHACALLRTGKVVCWGLDSVNQLGDGKGGSNVFSDHPIEVQGLTNVQEIALGTRASCARLEGRVWCWGTLSEEYPLDFNEKPIIMPTPTRVEGLEGAVELAVAEKEACARTTTGEAWCWTAKTTPARKFEHVAQVAAGKQHLCARFENGRVSCWGQNYNGQLGPSDPKEPQLVADLTNVLDVAAGAGHTSPCAHRNSRCWPAENPCNQGSFRNNLSAVHPNAELLTRFYTAFANKQPATMRASYAPNADFSDEVFPGLKGEEIGDMWEMLSQRAQNFRLEFRDVTADDTKGSAHWEAWYLFGGKRQVHNIIDATFTFRDGKIATHVDRFDFHRWSGQAIGLMGTLLGGTGFLKNKVRAQSRKTLDAWRAKHAAGGSRSGV